MTVYIKVNGGGSVSGDDNITAEPNTGVAEPEHSLLPLLIQTITLLTLQA